MFSVTKKGSALVFTLVILFLLFFIVSGMIGVSASLRSGGIATDHSVRAFQLADSGIERVMKASYEKAKSGKIVFSEVASAMGKDFNGANITCNTSLNLIVVSVAQGQKYTISVHDPKANPTILPCGTDLMGKQVFFESTGVYMNTARTVRKPVDFTIQQGGKSMVFDGTNPHILPENALFDLPSGTDFTLEFWAKIAPSNDFNTAVRSLFSSANPWGPDGYQVLIAPDYTGGPPGFLVFHRYMTGDILWSNSDLRDDKWHHVAITRSGTFFSMYVDGIKQQRTYNGSLNLMNNGPIILGINFLGEIANFRLTKGTSLYNANFTPSKSPLPAAGANEYVLWPAQIP